MAAASVRPDTEFREEDRSTAPWPFIDICLQDQKSDVIILRSSFNCGGNSPRMDSVGCWERAYKSAVFAVLH